MDSGDSKSPPTHKNNSVARVTTTPGDSSNTNFNTNVSSVTKTMLNVSDNIPDLNDDITDHIVKSQTNNDGFEAEMAKNVPEVHVPALQVQVSSFDTPNAKVTTHNNTSEGSATNEISLDELKDIPERLRVVLGRMKEESEFVTGGRGGGGDDGDRGGRGDDGDRGDGDRGDGDRGDGDRGDGDHSDNFRNHFHFHDNDDNSTFGYKLVRKKSGEIVKSSLKDSSYFDLKCSKSLPTTPSLKQVHFGDGFDVKYFKQKDKPTAISASNSPALSPELVGNDEDEEDKEFYGNNEDSVSSSFPNWKLSAINFAPVDYHCHININQSPVFLEKVVISPDRKYLLGHIGVQNIAFEKEVTVRYTCDQWVTIFENPTMFCPDIPVILKVNNYDRFIFQIPLASITPYNSNPHHFKLSMCIRYKARNLEFWDNNRLKNYELSLFKHTPGESFGSGSNSPSFASPIRSNRNERPRRYSSSYLRRRSSDSNLAGNNTNTKKPSFQDNSGDYNNDFIRNNFYLSSPLLSSMDTGSSTISSDTNSNINPSSDSLETTRNFHYNLDDQNVDLKQLNNSNNLFNRTSLDSKSYKDILDNYCFFNPNINRSQETIRGEKVKDEGEGEDKSSDTTDRSSDKSSDTTDRSTDKSDKGFDSRASIFNSPNGNDSMFTISSILGM